MKTQAPRKLARGTIAILAAAAQFLAINANADDKKSKYENAREAFVKKVNALVEKDRPAAIALFIKGARELAKTYPGETEARVLVLQSTEFIEDPKEKTAVLKILAALEDKKFASVANSAKGQIWRNSKPLGKPVDIQFKAIDGRDVDLTKMKGKVVLVDFWATWCGPCVAEIPNIKKTYAKWHKKGFEIVGISLDSDKDKLARFVGTRKMPWPQYFDDNGENRLPSSFGVTGIPDMWLIDKQGNLVDMEARHDLEKKVEKLISK